MIEQDLKAISTCRRRWPPGRWHLIYTSTAVATESPSTPPSTRSIPWWWKRRGSPSTGSPRPPPRSSASCTGRQRATGHHRPVLVGVRGGDRRQTPARDAKDRRGGNPLEVPADSGGSFLHMADLRRDGTVPPQSRGLREDVQFSTVYVTWEEVAQMVRDATGSRSEIRSIPRESGREAPFWPTPGSYPTPRPGAPGIQPHGAQGESIPERGDLNCWGEMNRKPDRPGSGYVIRRIPGAARIPASVAIAEPFR